MGFLLAWCQTIVWTNDDFLSILLLETKFMWNLNQNTIIFIDENAFENRWVSAWKT